jgi:hypothetical protein
MVKFAIFDVPPPGLVTVTAAVPTETMAAAGMVAVNCVALTNVVVGAVPPKLTTEAATKFVPAIMRVKAAPPATVVFGEIEVIVGNGGGGGGAAPPPPHPLIGKLTARTTRVIPNSALLFMTSSRLLSFPVLYGRISR